MEMILTMHLKEKQGNVKTQLSGISKIRMYNIILHLPIVYVKILVSFLTLAENKLKKRPEFGKNLSYLA